MPQINISVDICPSIYIRDPLETELGRKILKHSIILMSEIGFESFNFKKLAVKMESTEASVYRYFENKYRLLAYLVSWYWDFMHFLILMSCRNIASPKKRLQIIIETLVKAVEDDAVPDYVDMEKLHLLVVENATKVYHHKEVDELKLEGFYTNLRKLVERISGVIREINPKVKYPKTLANNLVDISLNHEYNIMHFPSLTDFHEEKKEGPRKATIEMIKYIFNRILD